MHCYDKPMSIHQRKDDHIRVNLEEDVGFLKLTTGLERFQFSHQALPELNIGEVDSRITLFGKTLSAPIMISSMTGGTERGLTINHNLAAAAQDRNIAMGVGSQRASIVDENSADTFRVRSVAPDILLFANIGAVQLNYGFDLDHCKRALDMIEADGLILHLNPLQELFQEGGDLEWRGVTEKIQSICAGLDVPVIAKEVGWGISEDVAKVLIDAGVTAIDAAGAGGTSWSQVEMLRAPTERLRRLGQAFRDWGIPTSESILALRKVRDQHPGRLESIFASGGIRNGLEISKCVALGADLVGLAGPFLKPAVESAEAVCQEIDLLMEELRIAMFCTGSATLEELRRPGLLKEE